MPVGRARWLLPLLLSALVAGFSGEAEGQRRGPAVRPGKASSARPASPHRPAGAEARRRHRTVRKPARSLRRGARSRRTPARFQLEHRRIHRALSKSTALVLDLDNTVVDTRPRTLAAVHRFARTEPGLSRSLRARLLATKKEDVGYDAADTASRLGLEGDASAAFKEVWLAVFNDTGNYRLDEPLPEAMRLIERAERSGKKIYILTGRWNTIHRPDTLKQLERLGLRTRAEGVFFKPPHEKTPAFKSRILARLGQQERILFLDDSKKNVAAVQKSYPRVRAAFVDFPVNAPADPELGPKVLRLPIEDAARPSSLR